MASGWRDGAQREVESPELELGLPDDALLLRLRGMLPFVPDTHGLEAIMHAWTDLRRYLREREPLLHEAAQDDRPRRAG